MMRKLRIVLCLAVTGCILAEAPNARADNSGVLKGRFVYAGSPPKRNKLVVNKDQDVCGAFNLLDEQLVVAEDGAIKDVAIYARKLKGDAADQSNEPVVLDNKDCRFAPHVVALRPGQTLLVKNSDPVAHNTDIKFSSNSAVNEGLPPSATKELKVGKSERKPVSVSCSIHPWMRGYIIVQDTPYIAITKDDGSFEISGLPVGKEVEFQVAHPKWKTAKFDVDGKAAKRGRFKVKIKSGDNDVGDLTIKAG
tara:strand:- start:20 stop:772 length:753 start_codon:yes stop_codon:yes gene_type:complete